jgi:hypothetical protein
MATDIVAIYSRELANIQHYEVLGCHKPSDPLIAPHESATNTWHFRVDHFFAPFGGAKQTDGTYDKKTAQKAASKETLKSTIRRQAPCPFPHPVAKSVPHEFDPTCHIVSSARNSTQPFTQSVHLEFKVAESNRSGSSHSQFYKSSNQPVTQSVQQEFESTERNRR